MFNNMMKVPKLSKEEIKDGIKHFEEMTKDAVGYIILTDRGTSAHCDKVNLQSMITIFLTHLFRDGELEKEELEEMFSLVFADEKELEKMALEKMQRLMENLKNISKELEEE